ncbi:hypothetical protein FIBSPDRAFT_936959 [Athelia psychrophila]|uniref:DUF6535 domain-containing protein n=1 Tax=Athelia psychrophila TaxID=1759441 RepID=A0A166B8K0_9AGAM|nr:hypothetical protein FIBSPDRAFT_936959 [Fibularhizoctonia sp. CBS 109695]
MPAKTDPPEGAIGNPPVFPAVAHKDTDAQRKEDEHRAKDSTPREKYDHPTGKIWSAGLFSATVTAFILESYGGLMPDPNAATVALLRQVSQQLAGNAVQNPTLAPGAFGPASSALRVNAFWTLSLCLALTCALAATLVQQWARHYTQAIQRRPAPHLQARMRVYLFKGMLKFKISAVVEGIPTLLHASVFLFFAGLVDFLYQINLPIALVTLFIIAACGGLYFLITILPVLHRQSPFRTPLSGPCWVILQLLGLLRHKSGKKWPRLVGSMTEGREFLAADPHHNRTKHASAGLSWLLKNLTEDAELQPFVEGIPAFCKKDDDADVMKNVLMDEDSKLLPRIIALLHTCDNSGSLKFAFRRVRSISFLNSMAKLCEIYAAHPDVSFLNAHEPALCHLIVPITKEADQQVASAAKFVVEVVVKHLVKCQHQLAQNHRLDHFPIRIRKWDLNPTRQHSTDPGVQSFAGNNVRFDSRDVSEDAIEEGSGDGTSQPAQATPGTLQMVQSQKLLANTPTAPCRVNAPTVEEGRDLWDGKDHADTSEATDFSHTVNPDDDIHLQKQEAETNGTVAPVTTPTLAEGKGDVDLTRPTPVTGLLQRPDSGYCQQQESEASTPMAPAAALKVEERGVDEELTESAQAIGGSEAVDSGDTIHPQQPGPLTHSSIRSATAPPVQEGNIDGEGEGEGKGESESESGGYI